MEIENNTSINQPSQKERKLFLTGIYSVIIIIVLFFLTLFMSDGAYWEKSMLKPILYDLFFVSIPIIVPLLIKRFSTRILSFITLSILASIILGKTKYNDGFEGMVIVIYLVIMLIVFILSQWLWNKLLKVSLYKPKLVLSILLILLTILSIISTFVITNDFNQRTYFNPKIELF